MSKPLSVDLRERVVAAVDGGLSRTRRIVILSVGIGLSPKGANLAPTKTSPADLRAAVSSRNGWRDQLGIGMLDLNAANRVADRVAMLMRGEAAPLNIVQFQPRGQHRRQAAPALAP